MDRICSGTQAEPTLIAGLASALWHLRYVRDPLGTLLAGQRRFGNIFGLARPSFRARAHKVVFAIGPEFNRQVLSDPEVFRPCSMSPKAATGTAMDRMRRGFQPASHAGSQQLRRMTQAPFSKKTVLGYHREIVAVADECFAAWPLETPFDLAERLRSYSLTLSNRLLFGAEAPERVQLLAERLDEFVRRVYFSSAVLLPFHFPGSPYTRLHRTCDTIAALLDQMIAERQGRDSGQRDILELLVRQQTPGGEIDLLGPTAFLLIASFETLATALTWTLFLLAQHPQTVADLVDELRGPLAGAAPRSDQLEQFPLLDAVIHEALRLFPPIPIVYRRSNHTDQDLGGMPIGWGDWIFLSQYATHRLPELYDRPQQFVPERWFSIRPGTYDYFPWGAGPRSCIGFSLGMTALRTSLAILLQKFRFALPAQTRIDRVVKVTINPRRGLPMLLHRPDDRFESFAVRGQVHEMVDLPPPHRVSSLARRRPSLPLRMTG